MHLEMHIYLNLILSSDKGANDEMMLEKLDVQATSTLRIHSGVFEFGNAAGCNVWTGNNGDV